MIFRHTDEEVKQYFANTSLNQSSIKVLIHDGIQKFEEDFETLTTQEDLFYEEKEHFIIGSAVDCWITMGEDIFNQKYAYSKLKQKPPDKVMSIIQEVFSKVVNFKSDNPNENNTPINKEIGWYSKELYDACDSNQYYMNRRIPTDKLVKYEEINELTGKKTGKSKMGPDMRTWEDDNRVENMLKDGIGQQYWQELLESQGKQLLSEYEKEKILTIKDSILSHKHTANLLKDRPNIDIIYQMPLFFQYEGVYCKMLPDIIIVDHNTQKIMEINIKTMGDYVLNFNKTCRRLRYDLGGAFYNYGIAVNKETIGDLIKKDISKYWISNPAFLVESTKRAGTPMIFVLKDELVAIGREGDGRYLEGWTQGVLKYKEWKALGYSLEERFKKTNGVVWLEAGYDYNETF